MFSFCKSWFDKCLAYFGYYHVKDIHRTQELANTLTLRCLGLLEAIEYFEEQKINGNIILSAILLSQGQDELILQEDFINEVGGQYRTMIEENENSTRLIVTILPEAASQ